MFKKIGLSIICAVGLGILSQQVYAGNEGKTTVTQTFDPQSVVFVTNRDSSDIAVIDMKTNKVIDRIECGDRLQSAHDYGNYGWKEAAYYGYTK